MARTLEELESFTHFVRHQLANDAKLTLKECFRLWLQHREMEATIEDIRQGAIDYENGLAQPLDEAFAEIRQRLGFPQESPDEDF